MPRGTGPVAPFHEELRRSIEARGLTLDRVSAHLGARGHPVSIAALSYWQSGRSIPSRSGSLRALGALERVLGVPPGHLAGRVSTPVPRQAHGPLISLADSVTQLAAVERLTSALGRDAEDTVRVLGSHWRSFVDVDGAVLYGHVRETVCALHPRTDSYVTSAWHPVAGQDVVITPLLGCRVRRMLASVAESVCVAELEIPPLARGAYHLLEYEISFPTVADRIPCDRAVACLPHPVRELVIEVNFPPDAVPATVRLVESPTTDGEPTRTPVAAPQVRMILARQQVGPGILGFEWDVPPGPEALEA